MKSKWEIIKILLHGLLTQKQWSAISIVLFLVSMIPVLILLGGIEIFCELSIDSSGHIFCPDLSLYRFWINSVFVVIFTFSIFSSVFAFYVDNNHRRVFWKTLSFLVPILLVIVFLGYETNFCLMMSCSNFGKQGVLVALYCFTVFVFGMGWPILFKERLNKIHIGKSLLVTIFIVSFLCIGVWKLGGMIQNHEREIKNYENFSSRKNSIEWCTKAFFSSTKNICLLNQAIKRHDQSICSEILSIEVSNYCISKVECSSFHPLYKTWTTNNTRCK